jgi:uncharacterized protein YbjQ (UPF0145 family)
MDFESKIKRRRNFMDPRMVTTAFEIPGFQITQSLGMVRGITVRSRSVFGSLGGALQSLVGGNITLFTSLCDKSREEAYTMLVKHAEELGAQGVIGVRYDATELMRGITEVICYGTAVQGNFLK